MLGLHFSRLIPVLALTLSATGSLSAQDTPPPQETLATSIPAIASRDVGGAFWHIEGNFDSILRIKNVLETSSLTVTPVLWMADGTEYDLAPITLDKAESASVNIRTALHDAPPNIAPHVSQFGSAGIRYSWRWSDASIAHIISRDEVDSLVYTTHASAPITPNPRVVLQKPQSNVEDGMWWLHTASVVPFLTLVNTGIDSITSHIEVSDATGATSTAEDITVEPGRSQLGQLDSLIRQLSGAPKCGGIRVSYTGLPGTLVVEGGMQDFDAGYSAPMPLLSLNARRVRQLISAKETTLAAIGVQLGTPETKMQFPEGTEFVPYATFRNLTAASLVVKLAASYMSPTPQTTDLGSITLSANQTLRVDMLSRLVQAGLATFNGEANFTFSFDGAADSLLVAAGSTAKDSTYIFNVDPMVLVPESGKIFCTWEVSGKTNTMISFWNSGHSAEDAELILFFTGGRYTLPVHLEANESRSIDIASLISSGVPDRNGNIIPSNIVEGSAHLTNPHGRRIPMDIKAHAAVFNVETATCWEPCPICDNVIYVITTPPDAVGGLGDQMPFSATATDNQGGTWDVTPNSTWSSSDTTVATVSAGGTASGVNYGSATISAKYIDQGVPSWGDGSLCKYPLPQCPRFVGQPTSPVKVQSCPTTVTVSYTLPASLPDYDHPDSRTGVGILTRMLVSPSVTDYTGTIIREVVTPISNSCPANIAAYSSFPNLYSSFTVGANAVFQGISFPSVTNSFYDKHTIYVNFDILSATSVSSCNAVATQVYSCNSQNIGTFTLTNTYTRGTLSGQSVTNVGTTKQ